MGLFNVKRLAALGIVAIIIAIIVVWRRNPPVSTTPTPSASTQTESIAQVDFTPQSSPQPFEELTIPYLRTRT